jgi:PKD repeat protein
METSPLRLLVSSLVLVVGCGGGAELILPGDGEPAAITVVDGDGQSGKVGEPLADPVVFQVTDSRGRPVEGVPVSFDVTSTPGADVVPPTTETNSDGTAGAQLVLGTVIGQQTGEARVVTGEGRPPISTTFSATAVPENANSMAPVGGQDQTGRVGQPLADRLVVEVTDEFGNPVPGIPISWTAEGGGSVSETLVTTGEDGRARVDRILGPAVGPQATIATSEGLAGSPVAFSHIAVAGDASLLVIVAGNGQTALVGSTLPIDLAVQLVDPDGNGVAGTALSWVVAVGGGTASPQNTTTDDQGRATTRWTLGGGIGVQRIDAVVSGVGFVSFLATATAATPPSLVIQTQPSSSARNGVPFDGQPVVQLRNASGGDDAVAGVQVRARLGSGGGELLGTLVRATDAFGRATFTDLAISGDAGRRTLRFEATGYASVSSAEINVAAPPLIPTTTTITGDSPDPSVAASAITITVQVASSAGTPTGTVTVSVSGPTPPAPCTATLSNGTGTCQFTLNIVGDRLFTAVYSGSSRFDGSQDTEAHVVMSAPPDNESPDADFDFQCDGLTCQFTDASEDDDGSVVAWSWNFGGTGTSGAANPTHTFPGPGEYEVTLTVTDNGGATDERSRNVRVDAPPPPNQVPTAGFTFDCNDLRCEFRDQSSDSDGRIQSRSWDFGDGGVSDHRDESHTYASAGTYPVRLTVTDDDGASHTAEHAVTVDAPNQRPSAQFTWTCNNLDCQFIDQSTDDGTVASWRWDFDDSGSESTAQSPQHTFSEAGTYRVRLDVEDNEGESSRIEQDVTVSEPPPPPNQPPTAAFSPTSCTTGQPCQFSSEGSNDSDGSIVGWAWNFGDSGSPDNASSSENPSHTYALAGTYPVSLSVTDDDGATTTASGDVVVQDPASAGARAAR